MALMMDRTIREYGMSSFTGPEKTPFAKWLIRHRKSKGWTQVRLAEEIDVDPSLVSKMEGGMSPSFITIQKLAAIFADTRNPEGTRRELLEGALRASGIVATEDDLTDEATQSIVQRIMDKVKYMASQDGSFGLEGLMSFERYLDFTAAESEGREVPVYASKIRPHGPDPLELKSKDQDTRRSNQIGNGEKKGV